MEGVLILPIVRRAIFFTVGVTVLTSGFTGVCIIGFSTCADLSSASCSPEKIGSRMSATSDGSTIFFLR